MLLSSIDFPVGLCFHKYCAVSTGSVKYMHVFVCMRGRGGLVQDDINNRARCHLRLVAFIMTWLVGLRHYRLCHRSGSLMASFFFFLWLYWEYIVTFTKVLTIYHSWIHALHHSPLFSLHCSETLLGKRWTLEVLLLGILHGFTHYTWCYLFNFGLM
jgi:hypothetical protein